MQLGMTKSSEPLINLKPYVIVEVDEPGIQTLHGFENLPSYKPYLSGQRGRTDPIDLSSDPTGTPHWNQEFDL